MKKKKNIKEPCTCNYGRNIVESNLDRTVVEDNLPDFKEVPYYTMDMNFSDKETKFLVELGRKEIVKDENELINYAVNHILKEVITKLEGKKELKNET